MGQSKKRSKVTKYSDSDPDELDGMNDEELNLNEQYYDDGEDDNGDDEEEAEEDMFESAEEEDEDEEEEDEEEGEEEISREDIEGGEEEDDEDGQNGGHDDAEMEELEKEYMNLRSQEQDILRNLKHHKDEDVLKGQAVKNQKAVWDKALEFRFLLQKAFSSSNRLPQEPVRTLFCDSNQEVKKAYANLITSSKKTLESLLELQEALVENNPSISQSSNGNHGQSANKHSKDSSNLEMEGDKEWLQISQLHKRIASFRDKSVDKWHRKTQVTTGAAAMKGKLQAFNQNISDQVATFMRDPSRMLKQMQLRKSTIGVFGAAPEVLKSDQGEGASPDGDPELLDDSEFYQQLLKEFFETIDPTSSDMAFYALKRMQTKKRKIVDRRASKNRKIRYNVHEKIVNFMAPQPMKLPATAPKLFENLFGLKTPKASSGI